MPLPLPKLSEGCYTMVSAFSDEALYEATGVRVAFTTREGGVSKGPFDSLNLGSHVGDDLDDVEWNRRAVCRAFGADVARLAVPNQVHGDKVLLLDNEAGFDAFAQEAAAGADALAVDVDGVSALLCFADCVPVIAVSPTGAFAVVHAGWRGVQNCISAKAVGALARHGSVGGKAFESELLAGMNVYIGPHIHVECFETSEEIRAGFQEKFGADVAPDARHVDLAACLRVQLVNVGVSSERICDVGICTVCNNDRFFSYRAQGGTAGRHGAFAFRRSL